MRTIRHGVQGAAPALHRRVQRALQRRGAAGSIRRQQLGHLPHHLCRVGRRGVSSTHDHHTRTKPGVGIALPSQVTSNTVGNSSSLVTAAQLVGVYAYAPTSSGPTCGHSRLCRLIRMAEAAADLQRQRPLDGAPGKLLGGHRRPALRAVCREATCVGIATTLEVHSAHIC